MPSLGSARRRLALVIALSALTLALLTPSAFARSIYTVNRDNNTVSVLDTLTNQLAGGPIPVVEEPASIAITPNGTTALVSSEDEPNLTVISTQSNQPIATIPLGETTFVIAISPDGGSAWATGRIENEVRVIDLRTNQVSGPPITVGKSTRAIAFAPDGKFAYVSDPTENSIHVVDTQTRQEVGGPIPVGIDPSSIAFTPDGRLAFVGDEEEGNVRVIDTQSRQVITVIPVVPGSDIHGLAITPDGTRAYVSSTENSAVFVIDTRTRQVVAGPISTPNLPREIAITPDGGTAYVAREGDSNVSAIDTRTNLVVDNTPVAGEPWKLAIVPNQSPFATFSASTSKASLQANFSGSASDPDGTISAFNWSFGDGTAATNAGAPLSHTYSKAGNYTASLAPVDNEGCSAGLVFTGRTAYCSGAPLAAQALTVIPNRFKFGRLVRNAKKGTAKLRVQVLAPGKLVLSGKQVKKAKRNARKAGTVVLPIKPKQKLQTALESQGSAKTKVRVTFRPTGGEAHAKTRSVLLTLE